MGAQGVIGQRKNMHFAVLVAAVFVASCNSGPSPDLSLDDAHGESKAVLETDRGQVVGQSGTNVPVKLPDGFSVYPGAKVLSNTSVAHSGKHEAFVVMASPDSPKAMREYYEKQARAAGVEPSLTLDGDESAMVAGTGPGGLNFTFSAAIAPTEKARAKLNDRIIKEDDTPGQREQKFAQKGIAKASEPSAEPGATTAQLTLRYNR